MGEWMYICIILDLGTRWRWVVSITPRPLYLQGKCPRYPLDRILGGPKSRSGRCGVEEPSGNRTPAVQSIYHHYTDWATPSMSTATIHSNIHWRCDRIKADKNETRVSFATANGQIQPNRWTGRASDVPQTLGTTVTRSQVHMPVPVHSLWEAGSWGWGQFGKPEEGNVRWWKPQPSSDSGH
jgi:hypothetical protein